MKKIFALILTLVITFGMTACGGSTKDIQPTDAAEPTAEPTPAPEVEYSDKWEIDYAVDDFGDPTEQVYIRSMPISGKFSNTATTDSDLTAVLFFEPYFTNPSNYTLNSRGNIETIDGNARSCLSFRLLICTFAAENEYIEKKNERYNPYFEWRYGLHNDALRVQRSHCHGYLFRLRGEPQPS